MKNDGIQNFLLVFCLFFQVGFLFFMAKRYENISVEIKTLEKNLLLALSENKESLENNFSVLERDLSLTAQSSEMNTLAGDLEKSLSAFDIPELPSLAWGVDTLINQWLKDAGNALIVKNYSEVFRLSKKVLLLDPGNSRALSLSAYAPLSENPYDRTLYENIDFTADQALIYNRDNALAYFVKGRIKELNSDCTGALSFYQNSLDLDPDHTETLEHLADLFQESHPEKSLVYLDLLVKNHPWSKEYSLMRAEVLFSLGEYKKSLAQLEKPSGLAAETGALELISSIKRKLTDIPGEKESLRLLAESGVIKQSYELRLAELSFMERDYETAERHYRNLLDRGELDESRIMDASEKLLIILDEKGCSSDILKYYRSCKGIKSSSMILCYGRALVDLECYTQAFNELSILEQRNFDDESVALLLKTARDNMP